MDYHTIRGDNVKEMLIYLTSECQLQCKHCFVPKEKPAKRLQIEDLRWLNDTFNIKKLNFLGGEPTLYQQLKEAYDVFHENTKITMTTNGVLLSTENSRTKELLEILKERKDNVAVQLSIQGNQKDTDDIRGIGIWYKVMNAVKLLKRHDIKCFLLCNYSKNNLHHLEKLIDTVSHPLHIPIVFFPEIGSQKIDMNEQAWFFNMILNKNNEYKGNNLIDQPHFYQWIGLPGRCGAGSERLCLTYNKELTPCHFDLSFILGKVGDTVESINKSRQFYIENYKKIQKSCNLCNRVDICRSGCYASGEYFNCPLQRNFTAEECAYRSSISNDSLSFQRENIKNLVKESLICG